METDPSAPSEDIAALMGFSSFGAAPKPKRRKYNPTIENAVTDASLTIQEKKQQQQQQQQQQPKDYRPSSGASGGNKVPLAKGRVIGKGATNSGPVPGGASPPNAALSYGPAAAGLAPSVGGTRGLGESADQSDDDDDGPAYVDTSSAPPAEDGSVAGAVTQEREHAGPSEVDTGRRAALHGGAAVPLPAAARRPSEVGGAGALQGGRLGGLQQRQEPRARRGAGEGGGPVGEGEAGVAPGGVRDWRALRMGVVGRDGDVAYYDESFVEDPWRELLVVAGRRGAGGEGHG